MLRTTLLTAAALSLGLSAVTAQADPRAEADLEALRSRYEAGGALEADVTLEIEFPDQPAEVQTGRILQDGERFRVEFAGQHVISDGTTVWMFLPDNLEVQVYDASESAGLAEGGFMRPQDILAMYESGDFEYAITDEPTVDGTALRQIEFKPVDRDSEFAKIRLTYDPAAEEVRRVRVFNKDGSRFALSLTAVETGGALAGDAFVFDESAYPGVSVEDMRL